MKKIKLFYLRSCPYCKKALTVIEKLKEKEYKNIEIDIEMIEESENIELASSYDYYYVPAFFVDEKKEHEGIVMVADIKRIFEKALSE
ncbi:MAG: thioredoxin family protein [Clostridia bacterium]|jgi:glutaredoxin|nr:thioredoxin [Clostridiales bacterium]